jgi:hypothetical protein
MQSNVAQVDGGDEPVGLIHGVRAIAKAINKSERATYHLLEKGLLPGAFKLGRNGGPWSLSLPKFREAIEQRAAIPTEATE